MIAFAYDDWTNRGEIVKEISDLAGANEPLVLLTACPQSYGPAGRTSFLKSSWQL